MTIKFFLRILCRVDFPKVPSNRIRPIFLAPIVPISSLHKNEVGGGKGQSKLSRQMMTSDIEGYESF